MVPNHPVEVIREGLHLFDRQGDNHKVVPPQPAINKVRNLLQVNKKSCFKFLHGSSTCKVSDRCGV